MRRSAKVTEEELIASFQQGVREGFAQTGETLYLVTTFFEGTQLRNFTSVDVDVVLATVSDVLENQGRGASIIVSVVGDEAVTQAASDDDVVDAEIIEGSQG